MERTFEENITGEIRKYTLEEIQKFSSVIDYIFHFPVIRFLLKEYQKNVKTSYSQDAGVDILGAEKRFRQYRALGVLFFCKDLYYNVYMQKNWHPHNREERIEAASVFLILHYFSVNVEMGSDSSVTLDISNTTKKSTFDRFCKENFELLIENYHKSLRRLKQKNIVEKDCIDLIQGYKNIISIIKHENRKEHKREHKEVIFYVDSPYVETKAYETNEKNWSTKEMKDLIDSLFASGQKFIFSMRACEKAKSTNSDKQLKQIQKTNEAILEVFKHFLCQAEKTNQELYVLAADFDMDELENRIKECKQCEIMITNYRIHNFYEIEDKINANFINKKEYKVLTFTEFFNIAGQALASF